MANHKLDFIDRKILAELQAEGRITNVELSSRVDISPPPCLRRVRALEESGFIQGYHADLDPKKLGFAVEVILMIGLDSQADADLRGFEERAQNWPLVRECFMLNGEFDFLLRAIAPDLDQFQQFLTDEVIPAPHVSMIKTSFLIRKTKYEPGVPREFLLKRD